MAKVTYEQVESCQEFESKIPAEQLAQLAKRRLERKLSTEVESKQTDEQREAIRIRCMENERENERKRDFSFQRFSGELQRQFDMSYEKFLPYPIEYQEAKKVLYKIFGLECEKKGRKMDYTDNNTAVINKLLSYFTGIQDQSIGDDELLTHKKGIYIFGDTGSGKSLLMRCMSMFCNNMEAAFKDARVPFTSRKFKPVECELIIDQVAIDKETDSMAAYYSAEWCFDDFGSKDTVKIYGNETPVINKIMLRRGNSYDRTGLITHVTSNIPFSKLETIYDERMVGRFNAMFHPIFLDGPNYRKK